MSEQLLRECQQYIREQMSVNDVATQWGVDLIVKIDTALASSPSQPALVELVARARLEVLDRHPCNSMHIEALDFFVAAIMLLADTPSISKASPKLRAALGAAAPALGDPKKDE